MSWWATLDRIEYLTFYLATPTFALFMRNAFPLDFSPRVIRGYVVLCLVFASSVLLTPVWLYSETLPYFQKDHPAASSSGCWPCWFGRHAAAPTVCRGWSWLSFVVLAVTVVNDILHSTFNTPYVVHYGLTFFLVVQSLLIAVNNQRARSARRAHRAQPRSADPRNDRAQRRAAAADRRTLAPALADAGDTGVRPAAEARARARYGDGAALSHRKDARRGRHGRGLRRGALEGREASRLESDPHERQRERPGTLSPARRRRRRR